MISKYRVFVDVGTLKLYDEFLVQKKYYENEEKEFRFIMRVGDIVLAERYGKNEYRNSKVVSFGADTKVLVNDSTVNVSNEDQ
jgi:hypothetical protein